ncbi:AraC family transcriptional regulator [Paenibacillus mendelii]|uniref:Helix-turn-helix domain-containing protein n=1 Tax=Paenibacillus mendelii TaxID=206163 RepID=A0ABV6J6Y2_9BACL|nr:AraC family transcriptional regulator [Paenibacillus mendelii]MCQ6561079.1 AraC family transcriptional regulator [Paenibacillus mendelii]
MTFPDLMKHGSVADPFYVEYARRIEPYNMRQNHFHPYYEIYYLLSGSRIYFIKDASYLVQAGDIVFIRKNEVHKTTQAGDSSHQRVILYFDDRYIRDWSDSQAKLLLSPFMSDNPVVRLPEEVRLLVDAHIHRMMNELHEEPVGCEFYYSQALNDILLLSARFQQTNVPVELEGTSAIHSKISEVARYLNANYAETIHIHDLSKRFYISPYYLSRVFKEVTGFTIIDYLNLTRVKEAQRLLQETSMSITDISAAIGFGNFSHFGKTFKKITRSSPREYRQGKALLRSSEEGQR